MAHLFECALCSFRPCLLQTRTMSAVSSSAGFDMFARIRAAFTISGNLHNAEVNAKNPVCFDKRRVRNTHRRHKIEIAADKRKVSLTLTKSEKSALVLTANKGQFQSPVNRPDRNLLFVNKPSQDAVIVSNCACRLKRALSALVEFVGVGDFSDSANNNLRGQSRRGSLRGVLRFMERVLPKRLIGPSPFTDTITDGVCGLHSAFQGIGLFRRYDQFYLCGKFHYTDIIPATVCNVNLTRKAGIRLRQTGFHSSVT